VVSSTQSQTRIHAGAPSNTMYDKKGDLHHPSPHCHAWAANWIGPDSMQWDWAHTATGITHAI